MIQSVQGSSAGVLRRGDCIRGRIPPWWKVEVAMKFEWLNEPAEWSEEGSSLRVRTEERTDFWRETHYGFLRDSGHFRFARATNDFTARVTFEGDYRELYDQAGLMLRLDERHWIKA